jgi:hypothetical protein
MADTKISQLPSATTPLSGAELVPLVQSGATVQTPTNEISKLTAATANTFTANQIIEVTDNVNAALRVTQLGTADALRIEDSTNPDSSPVVVDASGNVGVGGSPLSTLNVFSAAATTAQFRVTGGSAASPQAVLYGYASGVSGANGAGIGAGFISGGYGPLLLETSGTIRLSINASGDILNVSTGGLGYGTGSGGTVTQLTSKGTSVTLNKTNGQITMNNAALAAGSPVQFTLTNSTIASTDVIIAHVGGTGFGAAYSVQCMAGGAGSAVLRVTNLSGGSLSEAVVINFAVIKAVTS